MRGVTLQEAGKKKLPVEVRYDHSKTDIVRLRFLDLLWNLPAGRLLVFIVVLTTT